MIIAVAAGGVARGGGRGRHAPRAALCRGGLWRGENMEFLNLVISGELAFTLQNGFGGKFALRNYTPNLA